MKTVVLVSGVIAAMVATALHLLTLIALHDVLADIQPMLNTPLGKVRAYQVSCTTAAGGVTLSDGQPISSLFVFVNSATPVYVGGTDVDATHGMPICTATASCPSSSISFDVKDARCLSSAGTVTATVLAGTL